MIRADHIKLTEAVGLKRNPKDHNIGDINTSVKRFGFLERVLINETTGHILSGHGRVETLRKMKVQGSPPPVNIKIDNNEWFVPCDYVQLAESEEEAAAIALNRLVETGGWDEVMLTGILSDLAADGPENLDGIGFDTDDLDRMLGDIGGPDERGSESLEEGKEKYGVGEFAAEMQEKWQVQDGDIWTVGEHIIGCGSCRDGDFVSKVFDGRLANIAVTSPPYAMRRAKEYGGIPEDDYVEWWDKVQESVKERLTHDGSFFVNLKAHARDGQRSLYVIDLVASMVREHGWLFVDEFCWQRIGVPGSWINRFKNGFEPVFQFSKQKEIKFRPKAVGTESSGEKSPGVGNKSMGLEHWHMEDGFEWDSALPTNCLPSYGNAIGWGQAAAYPVGLPEFFVLAYTDIGDLVFDPFGGSGTTGVASHINDRKSVMIEKTPEYTSIMLERMMDTTKEEPHKQKG
jgi:site-specific DNA-methyltransferase (adenine-specific)/site-specific DNA-methyltransferase (cytosine-N4-specific)